jgi:hypothetical protein
VLAKITMTIWAVLPVLAMAYHFGPGQTGLHRDAAARRLVEAQEAEAIAIDAQAAAHAAQMATLQARQRALLSSTADQDDAMAAALKEEEEAYAIASDAWKAAADAYQVVEHLLGESDDALSIRWAKARALVRAGEIYNGIDQLQSIMDRIERDGIDDKALSLGAREELAAAHYYGARILREEGKPAELWKHSSGIARQQYRFLAENAKNGNDAESASNLQRNLERVLDLEQLDGSELVGKPLPKDSPRGRRPGDREPGNGRGITREPREGRGGNGASGMLEIGPGW